jgi:hypothetical protein
MGRHLAKFLTQAADALSQAHSTIAALRAEIGELKDELEDARAGACITGIGRFAVSRKIEAVTVWDRENNTYERYIPEARAEAEVKRLTEATEAACKDLRSFMTSFVREHFPNNTAWEPLPDLLGMLTQMDNASTIARDYKARIKALEEALRPFAGGDIDVSGSAVIIGYPEAHEALETARKAMESGE